MLEDFDGEIFETGENGELSITTAAQKYASNKANDNFQKAQAAVAFEQIKVLESKAKVQGDEISNSLYDSVNHGYGESNSKQSDKRAADEITKDFSKFIAESKTGFTSTEEALEAFKEANSSKTYDISKEKLNKMYSELSSQDLSDLQKIGANYISTDNQIKNIQKAQVGSMMSNDKNYTNIGTTGQEIVQSAVAKKMVEGGEYRKEAEKEVDAYSDEVLKEKFAELDDAIEYVDGEFYEIGEDGKRTLVEDSYSSDYMKDKLIASKMVDLSKPYAEDLSSKISSFKDTETGTADDKMAALQAYVNNIDGFQAKMIETYHTIDAFIAALQNGTENVRGFADATDKISEANSFNELKAAKREADAGDETEEQKAATEQEYNKQLETITKSESEKYELNYDEVVEQAEALAEAYDLDATSARNLAIQNQRMNQGVEELSKN